MYCEITGRDGRPGQPGQPGPPGPQGEVLPKHIPNFPTCYYILCDPNKLINKLIKLWMTTRSYNIQIANMHTAYEVPT